MYDPRQPSEKKSEAHLLQLPGVEGRCQYLVAGLHRFPRRATSYTRPMLRHSLLTRHAHEETGNMRSQLVSSSYDGSICSSVPEDSQNRRESTP